MPKFTNKGKRIRQINNMIIYYTELHGYGVWTPDGCLWEDNLTLEKAIDFCKNTKDFISKK